MILFLWYCDINLKRYIILEPKLLMSERFVDQNIGVSYRYVYSDTEYFRPHYHDYYEVFIMLDGTCNHYVNGSTIKLSKGNLVFIRPNDIHDYVDVSGDKFSFLNITCTKETITLMFDFLSSGFPAEPLLNAKLPPTVVLNVSEFARFEAKMNNIRAIDSKNHPAIKTQMRLLLLDIFTKYFSKFENSVDTVPYWLEDMCEQISKNGNFKKDSDFFFGLTDKTREHVSRSIKKYLGVTVSEYINSLRINYIANMLQNSNHSITDIVFESGFNNMSWASELFKEKYGMTMKDFRKQ